MPSSKHTAAPIARRALRVLPLACVLAATACTPPPDAPTEKPTEPRAAALRSAVQAPLEAAHTTQQHVDAAEVRRVEVVDTAGG